MLKQYLKIVKNRVVLCSRTLPIGALYGRTVCSFAVLDKNGDAVRDDFGFIKYYKTDVIWYCDNFDPIANGYYFHVYDKRRDKWAEVNTAYTSGYSPIYWAIARSGLKTRDVRPWTDFPKECEMPYEKKNKVHLQIPDNRRAFVRENVCVGDRFRSDFNDSNVPVRYKAVISLR